MVRLRQKANRQGENGMKELPKPSKRGRTCMRFLWPKSFKALLTHGINVSSPDGDEISTAGSAFEPKSPEGNLVAAIPKAEADDSGISKSPYDEAWSSLGEEEKNLLGKEDDIRDLFNQLLEMHQGNHEQSVFYRGLEAVRPYLDRLNIAIDFVGSFTSGEPTTATALGIIKGVSSLVIAVCSATQGIEDGIKLFLKHIPAIHRCSEVVSGRIELLNIHNALVDVYKDFLHFYLKVITIEGSDFMIHVISDLWESGLSEIISTFNTHAGHLFQLIDSENFAALQDIKDGTIEDLMVVSNTINHNKEHESAYHNKLKRRADGACRWIESDSQFTSWKTSPDSNFLALFGEMSCGKTMTTAYVVDALAKDKKQVVCAYYCKDDEETTNLGSIYRSLIRQLLYQKPNLKVSFSEWYKENSQSQTTATQSEIKLHEFFKSSLSSTDQRIFIVLDGLDECRFDSRTELLSLFQNVLKPGAQVKVFISSRDDDRIKKFLPPSSNQIHLLLTQKMALVVAKYLVSYTDISEEIHKEVADELSKRANGCAIWLQIALKYIEKSHIADLKGLQNALKSLPSYDELARLYQTLFDKVCGGIKDNKVRVQQALEVLAIAQRPLSLDELSYAVFISINNNKNMTMGDLNEDAHSINLLNLIRPFVSKIKVSGGKDLQLRLIHQSLKELILQSPPSEWGKVDGGGCEIQAMQRKAELHGSLLKSCVRYLLLYECGDAKFSSGFTYAPEVNPYNSMFEDEEVPISPVEVLNPSDLGLGSFFTYAASYWTVHFTDTSPERWPNPADFAKLCSRNSQRLNNWVKLWKRPSCPNTRMFKSFEVMSQLDPILMAAAFLPEAYLDNLLKCNLSDLKLKNESVWLAVKQLITRDCISTIYDLLRHKSLGKRLHSTSFIFKVLSVWPTARRWDGGLAKEWKYIFHFLITHQKLRQDLLEKGNAILRNAVNSGCLLLVKKLFRSAKHNAVLTKAILTDNFKLINDAIFSSDVEMVRFLCQQPSMQPHLRKLNDKGETVFHRAARSGRKEIMRSLIKHWPEGINIRDHGNDLPLDVLLFNHHPGGSINAVEIVKIMLKEGKADASGLNDDFGHSPLCSAIRTGNIDVCRVLIKDGSADMSCAVRVDAGTKSPFLMKNVETQEWVDKRKILKQLCTLLPLTVSTEYLFEL